MHREFPLQLPNLPGDSRLPRTLKIKAREDFLVPRVLHHRGLSGFEPDTLAVFLAVLGELPTGTFFDIGANTGVFALLAASTSSWEVVAFEPVDDLSNTISDLSALNELEIHVEERALGSNNGRATLFMSPTSDSSNSLVRGFREAKRTLEIDVEPLDHYVERTGRRPSLMKVDVESAEPAVLSGGRRTLLEDRPWIICEVLGGHTEVEMTDILSDLGYSWYQITPESPLVPRQEIFGDRSGKFANWLFAPDPPSPTFWERYEHMRTAISRCTPIGDRPRVALRVPAFSDSERSQALSDTWRPVRPPRNGQFDPLGERQVQIKCDFAEDEKFYFTHGSSALDIAPTDASSWKIDAETSYEVSLRLAVEAGTPDLQLWVLQYGESSRLRHKHVDCTNGSNVLKFDAVEGATCFRVAVRVAGQGIAHIGPLEVFEMI